MRSADVDVKYKAAFDYYNRGKYKKAADLFENLMLLSQGTPQEDTVQFYNAMSNYRFGDFTTAEKGFESFINVFPRSPFTHEAEYLRIQCLYEATYRYELDPMPTQKAMLVISEYMYNHPDSEHYPEFRAIINDLQGRLDRKSYESAKLYYTMEDYKAAIHALKAVLRDNADNMYREYVLYYTAMSAYKYALNSVEERQQERYLEFMDEYYNFVSEYPESPLRKELDTYFSRAQKFAKRNGFFDELRRTETDSEEDDGSRKISRQREKEVRRAEQELGVPDRSGRTVRMDEKELSREEKEELRQERKALRDAERETARQLQKTQKETRKAKKQKNDNR